MMELDPLTGLPRQPRKQAAQPLAFTSNTQMPDGSYGLSPMAGPGGTVGKAALPPVSPNYADLINNDPLFQQLKKDLGAFGIQDAAARAAATQRALVQFGQVPAFDQLAGLNPSWLNEDVSDQTRQLAAQNTASGMSIVARQEKAFKDQVRAIRNALAARGALRSGEFSHQMGEAQRGYDTAKFDASQELIDFITGLQAGFAASERQRQQQLAAGAEAAANRVPDQPAAVLPAAVPVDPLSGIVLPPDRRPNGGRRPAGGGGGGQPFMVD